MAVITVPVPNQPLFVWQPTLSTINVRGSVLGMGRVSRIGVYGSTITGTQSILFIPVIYTNTLRNAIFIHGYHLPVKTILGATRYRIPLIVWIWNYIVSNINVVANVKGTEFKVSVHAEAGHDTGHIGVAYMNLTNFEVEHNLLLAWMLTTFSRVKYVMSTSLSELKVKHSLFAKVLAPIEYIAHIGVSILEPVIIVGSLLARVLNPIQIYNRLKAIALQPNLKRTLRLRANVLKPVIESVAKLKAIILNGELFRTFKVKADVLSNDIKRTFKLKVDIVSSAIERFFKLKATVVGDTIERTFKLSAQPAISEIKEVISYIESNLVRRVFKQNMHVHSNLTKVTDKKALVHTDIYQHTDTRVLKTSLWHTIESKVSNAFRLMLTKTKQALGISLREVEQKQQIEMSAVNQRIDQKMAIKLHIENIKWQLKMFIHYLHISRESIYIDFDTLPLTATRILKVKPSSMPFVKSVNVMVTTCQTWILSYLSFVPDEIIQELDVHISTCSHTVVSLLQWYLTSGKISNEGYGNEVIFDLGDVDPIGPIPPVPSRQWEGGYVEDPFKGVGYVPTSDSVGYGSPSAEDWVSNAKMWWNQASDPFTGDK